MSGLVYLGRIAGPGEDVFPTTGPHLDVRVTPQFGAQKGKRINPETARTLLQNVLVGDKRTPLVQQQGDQWKWNFPITSGFGPRSAPTKGASTYHEGLDLGIGPENLAYKGTGSFKPGKGYGVLTTTDPQGNPYEIQFLHTKPAVENTLEQATTQVPQQSSSTDSRTEDILKAFLYGVQTREKEKKEPTIQEQIKGQLLGGLLSQAMNPMGFLSSYTTSDPFLSGQSAATSDYLNGLLG